VLAVPLLFLTPRHQPEDVQRGRAVPRGAADDQAAERAGLGAGVRETPCERETPCRPGSWASSNPLYYHKNAWANFNPLYYHKNAWANFNPLYYHKNAWANFVFVFASFGPT
jgi:hypothetical protein